MFTNILAAAIVIGALGLIFGILLALASKFFAVEVNPLIGKVREALPGANCGACGYPGCDGFAKAVADGDAQINGCPVCTAAQVAKLGEIMGVEASDVEPLVAVVRCQGTIDNANIKYTYEGITNCEAASQLADGYKVCKYACLGLGNCVKVCPVDAIKIVDNVAQIDREKCIACGKCVMECPRGIIGLVPVSASTIIKCRATAKGAEVRNACKVGCIGCGICEKSCPQGAIEMVNDLPVIDYEKCVNCGICAEKCPRECIAYDIEKRLVAVISEGKCVGCTMCKKVCEYDAIEGEVKQIHKVDPEKCVGCGKCYHECKFDAIEMKSRK